MSEPTAPARWRDQTGAEELANGLTHAVGAALGLGILLYLGAWSIAHADGWRIAGSVVYGVTLTALYTASTLYHLFRVPSWKAMFRRLDRAAIYLFIAGCYTPFTLVSLRDSWGLPLFATIWGLAALG